MYFDLTYCYYTKLTFFSSSAHEKQRYFLARNAREDANVEIGILAKIQSHVLQRDKESCVTQLLIHHYKSFHQ